MIARAAETIATADALLVTAGAGMGVDSGLPDFRGDAGFWNAYPPFAALRLRFIDLAQPRWFHSDPELAWGFYGHRLELYRKTKPHDGFRVLREIGKQKPGGSFVFTSNVDGQFGAAGFAEERIVECHGSLFHLQCLRGCADEIHSAEGVRIDVDRETMRARPPLPACPRCGDLARPNVLMFGDGGWLSARTDEQERRFDTWLRGVAAPGLVVVELGAGSSVPTVRNLGDRLAHHGARLVRINVREPEVPRGHIGLPLPAGEALAKIAARLA